MRRFLKKVMQTGNYFCQCWQSWQISPCQRTLQGDKSWHRIPAAWLRGPRDRQGQEKVWRVHWVAACSWQGTGSLASPAPPLSLPYHLHGGQGLSPSGNPPMGCGKWHMQPGTNYQVLNKKSYLYETYLLSEPVKFLGLYFQCSATAECLSEWSIHLSKWKMCQCWEEMWQRWGTYVKQVKNIILRISDHLLFYFPQDCDDSSDEKNCRTISFDEEKYLKNKPPPPPEGSSYLPITTR